MVANIPADMLPHMEWYAEDKLAVWSFYNERLEQYFIIAHTPNQDKVTHILFFGSKEASDRWTVLKDQLSEDNQKDADKVLKAFANSFETGPVTGRPGMSTLETSNKGNNRQWLNWTSI